MSQYFYEALGSSRHEAPDAEGGTPPGGAVVGDAATPRRGGDRSPPGLRRGFGLVVLSGAFGGLLLLLLSTTSFLVSSQSPSSASLRLGHFNDFLGTTALFSFENSSDRIGASVPPCLCLFDVDRTLTAKQQWSNRCWLSREYGDIVDASFQAGPLVLSDLAQGIGTTFCANCIRGVVTLGNATSDLERQAIMESLGGTNATISAVWQSAGFQAVVPPVTSTLVFDVLEGTKQQAVHWMVGWLRKRPALSALEDRNVYFFDDVAENISPFEGSGFNARQVSCGSRGPPEPWVAYAGKLGGCGGRASEIVRLEGVYLCDGRVLNRTKKAGKQAAAEG